jgi:hypothetical protein
LGKFHTAYGILEKVHSSIIVPLPPSCLPGYEEGSIFQCF